jgi:hypothetical protein
LANLIAAKTLFPELHHSDPAVSGQGVDERCTQKTRIIEAVRLNNAGFETGF